VVILGNDSFFCAGSSISLATTTPQPATATYLWSTGSTDASIIINQPGVYSVIVSDAGCLGSDSVYINEIIPPFVYLGPDTIVCSGTTVQLYMHGDHASYLWSNGSTGTSFIATHAGIYTATVSNSCGSFSDTLVVGVRHCDLFIPSAFTPNDDSKKDIFRVLGNFSDYTNVHFFIYNRWGQLVFSTDDLTKGWDGTFNGVPQELGTYFYYLTYHLGSVSGNMKGNLELIR
jgi:gliding motility-associated-like protein